MVSPGQFSLTGKVKAHPGILLFMGAPAPFLAIASDSSCEMCRKNDTFISFSDVNDGLVSVRGQLVINKNLVNIEKGINLE